MLGLGIDEKSDAAEGNPAQGQADREPGRGDVDVDPADQRDDRRQRVQPLAVRAWKIRLAMALTLREGSSRVPQLHPHVTVVVDEAAAAQLENAEFYR